MPLLDVNGSKEAGRPKTSSIWKRQAGCSGFNARPTKSWDVGAGGMGSLFRRAWRERIPVPFAALVMTKDVQVGINCIFMKDVEGNNPRRLQRWN